MKQSHPMVQMKSQTWKNTQFEFLLYHIEQVLQSSYDEITFLSSWIHTVLLKKKIYESIASLYHFTFKIWVSI